MNTQNRQISTPRARTLFDYTNLISPSTSDNTDTTNPRIKRRKISRPRMSDLFQNAIRQAASIRNLRNNAARVLTRSLRRIPAAFRLTREKTSDRYNLGEFKYTLNNPIQIPSNVERAILILERIYLDLQSRFNYIQSGREHFYTSQTT